MSDAKDAVKSAKGANARLAASCLARRDELAAAVAGLEKQRAEADALVQAGIGAEAEAILRTVEERLAKKRIELEAAKYDLKQAVGELGTLDRMAGKAASVDAQAAAAAVLDRDPLIQSPEERALENVRGHIADTDAHVRLNAELASEPALSSAAPVDAPAGASSKIDEAEARARFEALRERSGKGGGAPPKKTL